MIRVKNIIPISIIMGISGGIVVLVLSYSSYISRIEKSFLKYTLEWILIISGGLIPTGLFTYLILRKILRIQVNKAIKRFDNVKLIEILQKDKDLLFLKDSFEAPPIFLAVKKKNVAAVRILRKMGSHINIKDSKGISLREYAKLSENRDLIESLE